MLNMAARYVVPECKYLAVALLDAHGLHSVSK